MSRISPPERCRREAIVVLLAAVALYAAIPFQLFLQGFDAELGMSTAGLAALLGLSLLLREPAAVHLALLTALMGGWHWARIWPPFWPFGPLAPLVAYGLIAAAVPRLRRGVGWLRRGEFDTTVWWLVGITVVGSSVGLLLWYFILHPDLSHFLGSIPDWHPALLALGGLGFSLLNAAVEEGIFRGVVMQALEAAFGPGILALIVQALAFGAIHFIGIPNGWLGVGMAAVYGGMLGFIRRRSGGMLAPFAAHVVADVVIFAILVCWVR